MNRNTFGAAAAVITIGTACSACSAGNVAIAPGGARDGTAGRGPTVIQAGAPGAPGRPADRPSPAARAPHTAADVRFMQGMIAHHRQAIEMTALVDGRAARDDVRMLSRRIEASQQDEMALMERWLRARGEPAGLPSHDGQHTHMPGMLMPEELDRLKRASGVAFDNLFLEYMIRHHEGALTMVANLYTTDGAGQEPELFQFAQHVDADQRSEIARMRRMQNHQQPRPQ